MKYRVKRTMGLDDDKLILLIDYDTFDEANSAFVETLQDRTYERLSGDESNFHTVTLEEGDDLGWYAVRRGIWREQR